MVDAKTVCHMLHNTVIIMDDKIRAGLANFIEQQDKALTKACEMLDGDCPIEHDEDAVDICSCPSECRSDDAKCWKIYFMGLAKLGGDKDG